MSILDTLKQAANEGMTMAGVDSTHKFQLETTAKPSATSISALTSTVSSAVAKTETLTNNGVSDFFPGRTDAQNLVNMGHDTYRNKNTGDVFKVREDQNLATKFSGLRSLMGDGTQPAADATTTVNDDVFGYVTKNEWKQIINTKNNDAADASLPKANVDATGVEFVRTAKEVSNLNAGQLIIDGDKNIRKSADGTITTQTGGHTEIDQLGHKLIKDTALGTVSDLIDGRVAYTQNTKTNTQEWNTKQGVRVVEENGEYKIYNKDGVLVATRPIQVIANEVEQETLVNGQQMKRHLGGLMIDQIRDRGSKRLSESGVEWNVYHDGVSRTLSNGTTVGLLSSRDAFVEVGQTIVLRRNQDKKYFIIEGDKSQELDLKAKDKLSAPLQNAVRMLQWIDQDGKVHLGDGTFLTIKNDKVVGGTDEIVDEPVASNSSSSVPKSHSVIPFVDFTKSAVEVAMVSTGKDHATGQDTSTSALLGGIQSTYDWNNHKNTITETPKIVDEPVVDKSTGTKFVDLTQTLPALDQSGKELPAAKPIVVIDNNSVETADVVTTKKGTTDKVTKSVIHTDNSIDTSNGTHVSANNDIQFADGVRFGHDGSVTAADGRVIKSGNAAASDAVVQQAASALAAALSAASAIAGKAASGTVTFADIAELQASISNVNSMVGVCMNAGNLELAQSLMKTGSSLEGALSAAQHSFTSNTALRAARSNHNYQQPAAPSFLQVHRLAA